MAVLVVGSVALDDIETPLDKRTDLLGGSASYASVAASFFGPVHFVGIVGEDFPQEHVEFLRERGIDLAGLERAPGRTFRWSGKYYWDLNRRETLSVALNVFENFEPHLPENYREDNVVLLANIAPDLQHRVLDQTRRPHFVIADTMDLWIETTRPSLERLLARVNMLILNDSEARQLTGESSLIKAGRSLQSMGPEFVAVKKGEHGCLLFGRGEFFACPAFPLEEVADPTGAGDCFAGALAGCVAAELAASGGTPEVTFALLKKAVAWGTVIASFNVEDFSLERLRSLQFTEAHERLHLLRRFAEMGADW